MPLSSGSRLGPYEIQNLLGQGGMGEVYKARDTRLDRTVAIKVLPSAFSDDPTARQRFEREARAVSALDHPHICALYDIGSDGGLDYIVMQYVHGETLATRLERGPLRPDEASLMGAQIADALAAAHRRGIIHRDLKPGNIMIGREGVRLLDFGLAKQQPAVGISASDDKTVASALTAERTIVGTLQYMAPEQLEGRAVDARTDIFALGAVLYEVVTGRRAFEGDSSASLITAIMTGRPASIAAAAPAVPPALALIVERCLAHEPDDRWQTAGDLAYALRTVRQSSAAPAATATGSAPRTIPWGWLAVAGVVVGTTAAILLLPSSDTGEATREIRLSIVPPAGVKIAGDAASFDPEFALSPDGSRIAFVAVNGAGVQSLWVRDLSSVDAREIGGTTGASRPFWAPDGSAIGYVTPSGLARVSPDGGVATEITTDIVPDRGSSSTWTVDGRIIYEALAKERQRSMALFIVSAAGGAASPLMSSGAIKGEQSQRYPVALPDGKHVLLLSWTLDASERGIHLAGIEDGSRRLLVKSGFAPAFIAPDLLVYVRDRNLVAHRFSIADGQMIGEPVSIASGVALEAIPGQAAFTASPSGVVAYRSRERGVSSELRLVDRTGRPQEVFEASTDITVELAPDGRRVALARLNESRLDADRFPSSLWLLDLPRQVFSRLTVDLVATDENPTWSPDGLELAYASHRAGGLAEVLVQRSSGGAAPRVVATGPLNLHPIDWAPDGTLLLHAHGTQGGFDNLDLYALRPGSKGAEPLIEGPALQAQGQFSRDGRWIAYTSDESGRQEVYVQSATRGGSRSQVSSNGGAQPRWRGDGRELFYVSSAGDVIAVPMTIEGEMLTPGRPIILFTEPSLKINNSLFFYGGAAGYDVTADGSRFLVNRLTREPGAGPIHIVVNWQR